MEKSIMEQRYEEYLRSKDRKINVGSHIYFKIIHKSVVSLNGGTVIIVLPRRMFENQTLPEMIMDENEKHFLLGGVVHYSFGGSIPEWYLDTFSLIVRGIHDPSEIGSLAAVCDCQEPV